ncbi:MAG: hypothetical protein WD036_06460 [Bauldia sp.]
MRPRFRGLVWALPLAAAIMLAQVNGARAGLLACFEALAPLEAAKKAAEVAAKAGSCSAQATGDPVMAMTIAALTAAAMGGAFSTTDQCNALINGVVGKLVAEALLTLPLPDAAKNLLTAYVNGSTPMTFQQIAAAVPALNVVIAYIHCGCAVAGAPGEFAKIAKQYAAAAESCASFASDAINTFASGVGSLGEDIHEALHGPSMKPGVQQEQTCWLEILPDEVWTTTPIHTDPGFQCNVVRCQPGHVVIKKTTTGGTMNKCSAKCPDPIKTFQSGGKCYWTIDSKPVDSVCTQVPGVVHCCADGQRVLQWGVCSPACVQGIQYWSIPAGQCKNCRPGWYPVYQSSNSSIGVCAECPSGQTYSFSSKQCEPLNCPPPLGYFDPAHPHACSYCKPGQVYSAATGRCQCSEGTFAKGDSCACPKNANKQISAATFTCACPPGSTLDTDKFACVCPAGQQMVIKAIQGSNYSTCVSLNPAARTPTNKPPALVCRAGTHLVNGLCVPNTPPPARVVPRPLPSAPRLLQPPAVMAPPPQPMPPPPVAPTMLRCPAGTVPNATRTSCIRVPDQPTQFLLPPGLLVPLLPPPPPPPPPAPRMMVPAR